MLTHMPTNRARKGRKDDAGDGRACFRCINFIQNGEGAGCGLFVSAVLGRLGDLGALRAEGGACGPTGDRFQAMDSTVLSAMSCRGCKHSDYRSTSGKRNGKFYCWKFCDGIEPGLCAALRNPGGECGPNGCGYEVASTF